MQMIRPPQHGATTTRGFFVRRYAGRGWCAKNRRMLHHRFVAASHGQASSAHNMLRNRVLRNRKGESLLRVSHLSRTDGNIRLGQDLCWCSLALFVCCGPVGFRGGEPCKGGDMACVRGPQLGLLGLVPGTRGHVLGERGLALDSAGDSLPHGAALGEWRLVRYGR